MSRIMRNRPSPAIIVAVVALIAALGGTAVAGPGAESSAINRAKVKNIAAKQANKAIDARLPVTAGELGTINTRSFTEVVPTGLYRDETVNCQTGEKALSGGVKWDNAATDEFTPIVEFYKEGEGWYFRVFNGHSVDRNVTYEVYCLAA